MIAFNFEKQKTWEVLDYFKKYYDLNEASCQELDKNFNEYSKLYESNDQNLNTETYEQQELDKSLSDYKNNLISLKYDSFISHNDTSTIKNKENNILKTENDKDINIDTKKSNDISVIDTNLKNNEISEKIEKQGINDEFEQI